MRKCLRCQEEMIEGYVLKTSNLTSNASVLLGKGNGIFSDTMGKVKTAVCPVCGEISLYCQNVDQIK